MPEKRWLGLPPIESIIPDASNRTDVGYAMRIHMHGLHGAWHRLWGMLVVKATIGDAEEGIQAVREQVGQALGRPMTDQEFARLIEHAIAHAATLAKNK